MPSPQDCRPETYLRESERVSQKWGTSAQKKAVSPIAGWLDAPIIQKYYINPRFYGRPTEANWFMWVKERYLPVTVERILSLGCGDGCLERHAHAMAMARNYEAIDISSQAIEVAREQAADLGMNSIEYGVGDLNRLELKENRYDAVFMSSSLHHIQNLETLLSRVNQALKEDGLFVINEYVGASRFQWPLRQLLLINLVLNLLPRRYRIHCQTGRVKWLTWKPDVRDMERDDPSEAVRSAEIVPLVKRYFSVLDQVDFGGSILHRLMQDIAGNFDEQNPRDRALIKGIGRLEQGLIRLRFLPNDFTVMVARKKP